MFPWSFLPFDQQNHKKFLNMKPEEVENYIQQMMGMMFHPGMQEKMKPEEWLKKTRGHSAGTSSKTGVLDIDIFETHDFVFIRLKIQNEDWLKQMKLFYTSNQVMLEHIPETGDKHTLILPATVKRKGATASFKDGILELRLSKKVDLQYSEIDFQ